MARDHLTGTANRRTFEDALDAQLERCRREGLSLSVALVDLDRFKQYNDTFGHLAGDHCLVTVARAIQQRASRTGELVGRFGGDEFLVMWPGIDVATAQRNANRIRDSVRVLDLRIADKPMHVSVSIGGITIVPSAETTATALVHAADRAMYAVKRTGGDDTRWVTRPGPDPRGRGDARSRPAGAARRGCRPDRGGTPADPCRPVTLSDTSTPASRSSAMVASRSATCSAKCWPRSGGGGAWMRCTCCAPASSQAPPNPKAGGRRRPRPSRST